jgi:hypothetical protein
MDGREKNGGSVPALLSSQFNLWLYVRRVTIHMSSVADPGFSHGPGMRWGGRPANIEKCLRGLSDIKSRRNQIEAPLAPRLSAEGARIEAPRGLRSD